MSFLRAYQEPKALRQGKEIAAPYSSSEPEASRRNSPHYSSKHRKEASEQEQPEPAHAPARPQPATPPPPIHSSSLYPAISSPPLDAKQQLPGRPKPAAPVALIAIP
jgi:hypothetical protein